MQLAALPAAASWRHVGRRIGFEVLFAATGSAGHRLRGHTTGREGGSFWTVGYDIGLDEQWRTQRAEVVASTIDGDRTVSLARTRDDRWTVDGVRRPDLDGCVDVDLESSAVTNTLPLHRIDFVVDEPVAVPAAFVHAEDLRVERIEQRYKLTAATERGYTFHYASSTFDFVCELGYDLTGLVLTYPGLATRDR